MHKSIYDKIPAEDGDRLFYAVLRDVGVEGLLEIPDVWAAARAEFAEAVRKRWNDERRVKKE